MPSVPSSAPRAQVSAEGTERLAAVVASADGRFVLTGGAKGLIVLRWLHSLQVLWSFLGGTSFVPYCIFSAMRVVGVRSFSVHPAGRSPDLVGHDRVHCTLLRWLAMT